MQFTEKKHSTLMNILVAGAISFGLTTAATAAGIGGNATVGAGAKITPPAGGMAETRMGASGQINSNAQWQDTAEQGAARAQNRLDTAQERASSQADEMRTQAEDMRTQAEAARTRAQSQAEETRSQIQEMTPDVRAQSGATVGGSARPRR